jgi:hypothetical protein
MSHSLNISTLSLLPSPQASVAAATRAQASRSRAGLADPDSLPSWAKPLHSVSLAGWSLAGRNASYGRLRLRLRLEAG